MSKLTGTISRNRATDLAFDYGAYIVAREACRPWMDGLSIINFPAVPDGLLRRLAVMAGEFNKTKRRCKCDGFASWADGHEVDAWSEITRRRMLDIWTL